MSLFLGDWVLKQTSYFAFHPAKESHVRGHMSALIRAGNQKGGNLGERRIDCKKRRYNERVGLIYE